MASYRIVMMALEMKFIEKNWHAPTFAIWLEEWAKYIFMWAFYPASATYIVKIEILNLTHSWNTERLYKR